MAQPINTALCSFGMSGLVFHAPFISANSHFNLYGVWERSKNIASEKYPEIKIFRKLESMLEDDLIELVIVNTPNYTHFDFAKKALLAGKNVIIEKPISVTVKEGEELIEISKKVNKILSVFQNRRYDSDYKTVKKVIDQNLLGDLVEMEIHFDRFKEQLSPKIHKETPLPGSGSVYDLGAHIIDQSVQLFGMPHKVFADIRSVRPLSKVDDQWEILLYYKNLRVRLKASYLVRESIPGYILHGVDGTFLKERTDIQEIMLQKGEIPNDENWGVEPEEQRGLLHTKIEEKVIRTFIKSEKGNYHEYYNKVYEAIRNGKKLPVTAEEGVSVIKIIEAAYESNEKGCVITIN